MKIIFTFFCFLTFVGLSQEVIYKGRDIRYDEFIEIPCLGHNPTSITLNDTSLTLELSIVRKGKFIGDTCVYCQKNNKKGELFMQQLALYVRTGDVLRLCYYKSSNKYDKKYFYIMLVAINNHINCE